MRRRVLIAIAALVAGLMVNLALAVLLALDASPANSIGATVTTPAPRPAVWPGPVPTNWSADVPGAMTVSESRHTPLRSIAVYSMFGRSHELMSEGSPTSVMYQYTIERFGWPLRTLRRDFRANAVFTGGQLASSSVTPVEGRLGGLAHGTWAIQPAGLPTQRRIPIVPVFPGLIINTLFFASIFVLLYRGQQALVRHYAIKPGQCVKCRYSVAGLQQCPECGTPVASETIQPA